MLQNCSKLASTFVNNASELLQSCFKVACFKVASIYKKENSRCQIRKFRRMLENASKLLQHASTCFKTRFSYGFWLFLEGIIDMPFHEFKALENCFRWASKPCPALDEPREEQKEGWQELERPLERSSGNVSSPGQFTRRDVCTLAC